MHQNNIEQHLHLNGVKYEEGRDDEFVCYHPDAVGFKGNNKRLMELNEVIGFRGMVCCSRFVFLLCCIIISSPLNRCFVFRTSIASRHSHLLKTKSTAESSAYGDTQIGIKIVIGGLTSISNLFLNNNPAESRVYNKTVLTPIEILDGVIGDFENGYLFSGQIDSEIYNEDCVFTDPTLSFKGLSTFERNIKALKPVLDKFVGDSSVILYDCQLDLAAKQVRAIWRMSGAVNLPWRPRIELTGNTILSYDTNKGGRIVDYYERWDLPAATALLQLFQPSVRRIERPILKGGTASIKAKPVENSRAATETINIKKLKATIALIISDGSTSNFESDVVVADAVSLLIRGSSREALNAFDGSENSIGITEEEAAVVTIQDLQNCREFSYELLYTSVKREDGYDDVLGIFLSKFKDSLPVIQFTDLNSTEGIINNLLQIGPFSIQIAATCIQPDASKATLLISKKKILVRMILLPFLLNAVLGR